VAIIGYHSGDAFQNAAASARFTYYNITGTPYVKMDGDSTVVGGEASGNMYPCYRAYFDTRKSVESPLDIGLFCSYDSTTRQGRLEITVKNTTASAVSGQLQVALCESHIPYAWYDLDSVHHVERAMLPDANGEAITVPANDSITKSRVFTVDPTWVARHCDIIVFVQDNSTKAMYQGASVGVYQEPVMEYRGCQNAFLEPGADVNLFVGLVNRGTGPADSISAVLSTTDMEITVTTPNAVFGSAGTGEDVFSQTPFGLHVSNTHANHTLTSMNLAVSGAGGYTAALDFPLYVSTNRGFSDDMERGDNNWTHSGLRDNWHQTEHRSQSAIHSWYPGTEGSWQYTNENDTRLVTPWFTSDDSSQLSFDHWYKLETDYDYAMPEVNNGSKFWVPLAMYTGSNPNWTHATFPMGQWSGQTVRVAFRFISDPGTTDEGWYVDDFLCEPYHVGVSEPAPGAEVRRPKLEVRSPASRTASVAYALPAGQRSSLSVFDVNGRRVATLGSQLTGSGRLAWDLTKVEAGTYFCRLVSEAGSSTVKVLVAK